MDTNSIISEYTNTAKDNHRVKILRHIKTNLLHFTIY